ncbi:MAG: FAD-binding oxidoreductase, partial [Chitinophagaceae bacterium]
AVSSFLLLTMASVTGIVLAVEAISVKAQGYKVDDFNSITLAEVIPVVKKQFQDVQDLKVDDNGFVILKWTNEDGDSKESFIDPRTGKILGEVKPQSEFYKWMTALHRSLFIHETGRFLIGLTSFLLILIAVSGMILVVQRQQSFKRFFARIERGSFAQYYHVLFGRLALVPILVVAITGTWLSVVRFELVTEDKFTGQVNLDSLRSEPIIPVDQFKVFRETPLSQVQSVQFPFADDPEEFYVAKLEDKEITVNQLTGDLLLEQNYSTATQMSSLSLRLHTGRSGIIWAIIFAITCGYILFFIYSGFVITFKRRKNRLINKFKSDESRIIILVGSENGTTMQ